MKSFVFILLVLLLLLLSEGVTLLSTHAAPPRQPTAWPVKVQSVGFSYKWDEKARFLALKNDWQAAHRGDLPMDQAIAFANTAYDAATVDAPLNRWVYQGGPSPWVFAASAHLYNAGKQALLNVPVRVTVRAKVGELRVNPSLQMTDADYLARTAGWETVSRELKTIPAFAPGEDLLLPVLKFQLLDFLKQHPDRWPVAIEVSFSSPRMRATGKSLSLTPDHFVMPVIY